jgi:hypothetical protein
MSPGHASRGSPSSLVLRTARNSRRGRQSPATPDARARLAAVRCVVRGTECPSKAFAPLRGHRKHRTSIVRAPVHRAATEAAPCPIVSSDSSATIAIRARHPLGQSSANASSAAAAGFRSGHRRDPPSREPGGSQIHRLPGLAWQSCAHVRDEDRTGRTPTTTAASATTGIAVTLTNPAPSSNATQLSMRSGRS